VDKFYPLDKPEAEFTFGKDQYHLNNTISNWCEENIGPGGYVYSDPGDWETRRWAVWSMFGETTWLFACKADATLFALKWQ
jgi:hypothetical protein